MLSCGRAIRLAPQRQLCGQSLRGAAARLCCLFCMFPSVYRSDENSEHPMANLCRHSYRAEKVLSLQDVGLDKEEGHAGQEYADI